MKTKTSTTSRLEQHHEVAGLAEDAYVFRPNRETLPSRTETRVLAALSKLGTSMGVVEDLVTKTGISPMTILRLAGLPPIDPRTDQGRYLLELYDARRGAALR